MRRPSKLNVGVLAIVGALFAAVTGPPVTAQADYLGYPDLDLGVWYVDDGTVAWSEENHVINGEGDGRWNPNGRMDRGQAATILFNYSGDEAPAEKATFDDAETFGWAASSIAWAQDNGVFNGNAHPDGTVTMDPWTPLSREQAATIFFNMFGEGKKGDPSSLVGYEDADEVSDWAMENVAWAAENGVMGNSGNLAAKSGCTRAEFVAMLKNVTQIGGGDPGQEVGEDQDINANINPSDPSTIPDRSHPTEIVYDHDLRIAQEEASEVIQSGEQMTLKFDEIPQGFVAGDVIMIPPSEDIPFGAAIEVASLSIEGDSATVIGTKPELSDVYDTAIISEHLDINDLATGDASLMASSLGGVSKEISIDLGEFGTLEGKLTIEDFDSDVFIIPLLVTNIIDIDYSADLKFEMSFGISALPPNMQKTEILSRPIPFAGALGWGAYFNIYLSTDLSGNVSLSSDITVEGEITKDAFKPLQSDGTCVVSAKDSTAVSVEGKIGPAATLSVKAAGWDIVEGGAEAGLKTKAAVVQHPNLTCGDISIWAYGEIFAEAFEDTPVTLKVTKEVMSEDNSVWKLSLHVENGKRVPKCTWDEPGESDDPGAGEGALDPSFDGIPVPADEGWGTKPTWTTDEDGGAIIAEPFYIKAGTRMVITTRENSEAGAMFWTEGDTLAIRREVFHGNGSTYSSALMNNVASGWNSLNGISTFTIDVLVGQVKVTNLSGSGRSGAPLYTLPIISFEQIDAPDYPVSISATSVSMTVGESYDLSASSTLNTLLAEQGLETKDWWDIYWRSEDRGVIDIDYAKNSGGTTTIVAKSPGTTYVIARFGTTPEANGRGFYRYCRVTVTE